jgi:hypothetical protein
MGVGPIVAESPIGFPHPLNKWAGFFLSLGKYQHHNETYRETNNRYVYSKAVYHSQKTPVIFCEKYGA